VPRTFKIPLAVALVVLLGSPAARAATRGKAWDDSYYATFTTSKFTVYKPVNQEINFKKVDARLLSAAIFYETNWRRLKHRLKPLAYSPALRRAAFGHSKDMVEKDFHGHVNPDDPKKRTLVQRLKRVGISRCHMSENVAFVPGRRYPIISRKPGSGQIQVDPNNTPKPHTYASFARQLLDGWMLSPPHRKNVLSTSMRYLGCAAVYCPHQLLTERGKVIPLDYFKATQNFASQRGPDPK